MPLVLAAGDAQAGRRVAAAAAAVALQGVFYWLMLNEAVAPTALPRSAPLEVTIFEVTMRRKPAGVPPRERRRMPPRQALRRQPGAATPTLGQAITRPQPSRSAPRAPVDWQQALQDEARAAAARSQPRKLSFGFPQQPPPARAAPDFGWDHARTHRVEPLSDGGMLINLNDSCAVVIYVLPIPVCRIGHIPVNGELFDHMRDRRDLEQSGLP